MTYKGLGKESREGEKKEVWDLPTKNILRMSKSRRERQHGWNTRTVGAVVWMCPPKSMCWKLTLQCSHVGKGGPMGRSWGFRLRERFNANYYKRAWGCGFDLLLSLPLSLPFCHGMVQQDATPWSWTCPQNCGSLSLRQVNFCL